MSENNRDYKQDDYDFIISLIKKSRDKHISDEVIQEIKSLDRQYLLDILTYLLGGMDLEVRDDAIKVLMQVDPYSGVDIIIKLLDDPIDAWRWYICGALADYGDDRAVEPLNKILIHDQDSDTRFMAALALQKIGDSRALPALQHAQQYDRGTDYEGRRIDTLAAEAIQTISRRMG